MSKAQELRERYEKDLKDLQEACPHKETCVLPNCWAPAHCFGEVEVCIECDKVIKEIEPVYEL